MSTNVAETLAAISDASETVTENDSELKERSQRLLALLVMAVWGAAVLILFIWTWRTGIGSKEFICNTPAAEADGQPTDCTNGWVATRDQMKEVFTFGVVPFATLILGFYFGQKSAGSEE